MLPFSVLKDLDLLHTVGLGLSIQEFGKSGRNADDKHLLNNQHVSLSTLPSPLTNVEENLLNNSNCTTVITLLVSKFIPYLSLSYTGCVREDELE